MAIQDVAPVVVVEYNYTICYPLDLLSTRPQFHDGSVSKIMDLVIGNHAEMKYI